MRTVRAEKGYAPQTMRTRTIRRLGGRTVPGSSHPNVSAPHVLTDVEYHGETVR